MRTSFTALAAMVLLLAAGAAQASLEVTRSTSPRIRIGTKFHDNAVFDVPAGQEIELLQTPQNTTHQIAGPYKGNLANYANPCPWWKALIGSCKQPGQENKEGATRGIAAPKSP